MLCTVFLFAFFVFLSGCDKVNNIEQLNSDITANGMNLVDAIERNDIDEFSHLLKTGVNPNFRTQKGNVSQNKVLMEIAAMHRNSEFLRLALRHGGNSNAKDRCLNHGIIFKTIESNLPENLLLLINHNADINEQGLNEKTPLSLAIAIKKFHLANILLDKGADPSLKNKWGYSAIDIFTTFGDAGVHLGSENYDWYIKLAHKFNIDPNKIKKKRK